MRQNPHVRICGGPGSATTLVYPTAFRPRRQTPARRPTSRRAVHRALTRAANASVFASPCSRLAMRGRSIMLKELTAAALLFVFAGSMIVAADAIIFKKVDVFEMEGEDEKKRDARMELASDGRVLSIVDEKKGAEKMTYAVIPYDALTKIVGYIRVSQMA